MVNKHLEFFVLIQLHFDSADVLHQVVSCCVFETQVKVSFVLFAVVNGENLNRFVELQHLLLCL